MSYFSLLSIFSVPKLFSLPHIFQFIIGSTSYFSVDTLNLFGDVINSSFVLLQNNHLFIYLRYIVFYFLHLV